MARLDRHNLKIRLLRERKSFIEIMKVAVSPDMALPSIETALAGQITRTAAVIRQAREAGKPVMITFGAHLIKNGLAPLLIHLLETGMVTHLATNGAGSIHDWEFAFQGVSSEDVRANVAAGQFGIWEETGRFINLAIALGGYQDLGYGAAVGKLIQQDGLTLPTAESLREFIAQEVQVLMPSERLAAAADLLTLLTREVLPDGWLPVAHLHKAYSVQATAYRLGVPLTVHPGIGYDIIYTHPFNNGGAIGRAALRDFLSYAESVSRLQGGVHLSVGSAVMAPMIFEKSVSMANNLALQRNGEPMRDFHLVVNDIQQGGDWDWRQGEPPKEHPAYYLRFCKSFYRMGGELEYICLDNRTFLLGLVKELAVRS